MKITRENKVIIQNTYATYVALDGTILHITVRRPGEEPRDIRLTSLTDFRAFVDGCMEVLIAAEKDFLGDVTLEKKLLPLETK